LAAAVTLAAGGCGGSSQREAVSTYVTRIGRIEAALATPLKAVSQAGNQFAQERAAGGSSTGGALAAAHERTLLRALEQIRGLRAQAAALKTPGAAGRLRALVLELIDRQAAMTREVAQLVVFLPSFNTALAPLGLATRQLEVVLSKQTALGTAAVAAVYSAKAAALRGFKVAVDAVAANLRRLRPPAVSKPTFDSQLRSLQGMSASAGKLANAIGSGPAGNVQPLLLAFDRAATSTHTVAVQKAEIASLRAYDSQDSKLQALAQQIERERLRLSGSLR
jgi:hypothetical protein